MLTNFPLSLDDDDVLHYPLQTCIEFFDTSQSLKNSKLCLFHGRPEDDKPSVPTFKVSQEKARSLGINFIPLEVSLKGMIESLKEKGLLSFWIMCCLKESDKYMQINVILTL